MSLSPKLANSTPFSVTDILEQETYSRSFNPSLNSSLKIIESGPEEGSTTPPSPYHHLHHLDTSASASPITTMNVPSTPSAYMHVPQLSHPQFPQYCNGDFGSHYGSNTATTGWVGYGGTTTDPRFSASNDFMSSYLIILI